MVYATLKPGQHAELQAGSAKPPNPFAWGVYRGRAGSLEPFVLSKQGSHAARPEGWAHLMDRQRATAIAVDGFARGTEDRLHVSGDGELAVRRKFAKGATRKRLIFWCHFVSFPLQIGAMTSAQSMQAPLRVSQPNPTAD